MRAIVLLAALAALTAHAAEPKVADVLDVGVKLGEAVEASQDRLDGRRRLTVYDLDGRPVLGAVMVPVAKPGAIVPPTATKVLGAALVVRDGAGWRVAAVRYDFRAPEADTAKALAVAEAFRGRGVRGRAPDAPGGWATITAADGSQEAADLALSVADFFARLHARREGAR